MADRRTFLRGLASLPMVGGGVTLLGNPTAAAVPVADYLLEAYNEWLDLERSWLQFERFGPRSRRVVEDSRHPEVVWRDRQTGKCWTSTYATSFSGFDHTNAASRAAVVLAAAGVDIRQPRQLAPRCR